MNITVLSVADEPVITVPAAPSMLEDGILFVNGLSIYDGDVSAPSDGANFTVWLEATAGRVVLGNVSLVMLLPCVTAVALDSWGYAEECLTQNCSGHSLHC